MYTFLNKVPFGAMVLEDDNLIIKYMNDKMRKAFKISQECLKGEYAKTILTEELLEKINYCKSNRKEEYLRGYRLSCGKKLDINISIVDDTVQIFANEVHDEMYLDYESIIEVFPSFTFLYDLEGNINYINKEGRKTLALYNDNNVKNIFELSKMFNLYDNDGKKVFLDDYLVNRTIREEKNVIGEVLTLKQDCGKKYILSSSFLIHKNNKAIGGICIIADISDYYRDVIKNKEEIEKYVALSMEFKTKCDIIEILREREKQHLMHLKDVINNISEGIFVVDNNFRINLCNKSACNILELKQIELLDYQNIIKKYNISCNNSDVDVYNYFHTFYEEKSPIKNLILNLEEKKSNRIKYIEINTNPIIKGDGELLYTVISIKDVTDEKVNKLIAENQSKFIEKVLSNLNLPVIVVDYPELRVSLINNLGVEFVEEVLELDCTEEDIIGKGINEISPKAIEDELINGVFHSGNYDKEVIISPYHVKQSQGKEKYYKFKITPFMYKDNHKRIYIHIIDITEEITVNKELEKINKLKDEFFTIISHELRTPLTIINSALQLAYDIYKDEFTYNVDRTLDRIKQNCSRLLKLTNNVMDISSADAGLMKINNENFDIVMESEFVVNSVDYYARQKGINIIFDTNKEEYDVIIDKEKYIRILLNLLSNAIKYTPENKNIYVDLVLMQDKFRIYVKDEGVGIQEGQLNSIFNRYLQLDNGLTRRAEGLGLGLTVVKKFVEKMDGSIVVNSKKNMGSEFILEFDRYSNVNSSEKQLVTIHESFDDLLTIEMSDIY
ncbi:PAS domain-containing protein [Clostridium sp. MSJ-11]|uniref:histidine kinase n=1 Tax=Clostridium mobile TaxID=2841512 RepID=A0ABS6ED32_9CLOT|nr:ATP-binding protein [Clostridium mobile]MBU5483098.1 PAS domain-containing protein [Clostridium mobile]